MTVIVYRDGMMAADRQSMISGVRACQVTKIARRESDGALIGVAGDAALASAYMRWFVADEQGDRPAMHVSADDQKTALALIVRPDGSVEEHSVSGWAPVEGEFYAYGSGLEAAIAAMHMGADARRAVEITNLVTIGCGMGIDVVHLRRSAPRAASMTRREARSLMRAFERAYEKWWDELSSGTKDGIPVAPLTGTVLFEFFLSELASSPSQKSSRPLTEKKA